MPDFDGTSVVQTHMTNSRLTDPEVLETRFPVRIVSYGLAPSTSGEETASVVDAGAGLPADFERLGAKARGAIVLVRTEPMKSFDDLFAEYLAARIKRDAPAVHARMKAGD